MPLSPILSNPPLEIEPLLEAGLSVAIVESAVLKGEHRRNEATKHHPPTAGGLFSWMERVRALRDHLVPLGWTTCDRQNLPTVVSPCGRYALATTSGDERTGLRVGRQPSTKYGKGMATQAAVISNQQLLFPLEDEIEDSPDREFWVLLVRQAHDGEQQIMRVEVSRPAEFTPNGVICGWDSRWIIEPVLLDPIVLPDPSHLAGEAIDIQIKKKNL